MMGLIIRNHFDQYGVALVSMLLVLAIVTALTGRMLSTSYYEIQQASIVQNAAQASVLALSAMRAVISQMNNEVDSKGLKSQWLEYETEIPIERGNVSVSLVDPQAKFNINNLRRADGSIDSGQLAVLERLADQLDMDRDVVDALADWLDSDVESRGYATEDIGYMQREPAYRAANQALSDESELRLIRGINNKGKRLTDYVSVLPSVVPVNINTASAEVLQALLPGSMVPSLPTRRPYQSVDELLADQVTAGIELPSMVRDNIGQYLTVRSEYLVVRVTARVDGTSVGWRALVRRDEELKVEMLWKAQLPFWELKLFGAETGVSVNGLSRINNMGELEL